jgi:TIM21
LWLCLQDKATGENKKEGQDSIVYSEGEAGDLSDKVAPVSRPEAAGWSFVIVAAYSITAFLIYTVYTSIIVEGPEDKVFNQALEAVRKDFRVTSLLGKTIKGAHKLSSH